ncbi:MAG: glycerol-3-phosphate acyltransferase [Cyanobacteria bacterium P01_A01_bin.116]
MSQVLGALLIFTLIPALGALPLTGWIVHLLTGKTLKTLGTGNTSVSAAFYHGGTLAGICSVTVEALKGIFAVLLARHFFGGSAYSADIWPVLSLIFLVMGRYWGSQGAGTTNIAWGFFTYDPLVATLTFGISFVGFTILRMKNEGKLFVLVLMPVLTALAHPTQGGRILAVACLSGLVFWIYSKIPDDLELPPMKSASDSRRLFRFFQGDRALKSLATVLSPTEVGPKAATLSQLNAWGYPVAPGYILPAGDDPSALIKAVSPTPTDPVVVRSSAIGEDTPNASAAGQYVSVTQVESPAALEQAITVCLNAYNAPSAVRYRQTNNIGEGNMSVLVQPHIFGEFSGVAFSRDPVAHTGDAVIVEALAGDASRVVSGQVTPERYQIGIGPLSAGDPSSDTRDSANRWQLPAELDLTVQEIGSSTGQAPKALIQQVAYLARHLENSFHGVPQDMEWTFDGQQLWVLQSRPITTLLPIWTRKIAAEVIPGVIRPLTWSINRPLTCGVWGTLFSTVLGDRANGIDFSETATLHAARAYFNATLLGDLFTRMGLPAESLEFLTRGTSFNRPPLAVTLRNTPGLWRLLQQEMSLPKRFADDYQTVFEPAQSATKALQLSALTESEILTRVDEILALLEQATYYNIMAPLSLALRQALFKVDLATLDNSHTPEVKALDALKTMAAQLRSLLPDLNPDLDFQPEATAPTTSAALFAALSEHPEGDRVFEQLDHFLNRYGYLSEVATDISIPTWRESPHAVRELLAQYLLNPAPNDAANPSTEASSSTTQPSASGWKAGQVQKRLTLKGQVAEVYDRLLASLRGCFVELENRWLATHHLAGPGDIFFLTAVAIRTQVAAPVSAEQLQRTVELAKRQWQVQGEQKVPYLVYGNPTAEVLSATNAATSLALREARASETRSGTLRGIGASAGQAEGTIRVLSDLSNTVNIDAHTILVVPYTDAGWSPLLARIGGLIAEVGGQLSHGAIIAREYGIPAVMDVTDATQRFTDGQRVRIDGQQGTIEIL